MTRVAGLAVMIVLIPGTGIAADTPTPAALRAVLADPVDPAYVEVDQGTQGTIEGPFDAARYADSGALPNAQLRQRMIDRLNRNGFLSGYGREWYKPRERIFLGETVLAFVNTAGAAALWKMGKVDYAAGKGFDKFVDASGIPGAYALNEVSTEGFHWTIVSFTKGNELFAVAGGSDSEYTSAEVLAQGRKEFALASPGALASTRPTGRVGFVVALILVAAVISVLVLWAAVRPRQRR